MEYRDAVEIVERAMPHADVSETKRIADALVAAYEAGRAERELLKPDAQGYFHVTEDCYEDLRADARRMDYIRQHCTIDSRGLELGPWPTDIGDGVDQRLDAAIKQEAGQ